MRLPQLVASVGRALRAAGTPARGETLLVALSGGADSVALVDTLALLSRPRGFRLLAAHLDHRLRPGSEEDAAFCAELCRRLGVELRVGRADVRARAARERGGLEQAARRERYLFLRAVREREQAAAIALAHTLDDQAETLLLRLLRGAGALGLGAMRARSGDLLRPLLGVSRAQVLAHLRERSLPWREDPTNADPALRRNRVRHELLPYLEQRFNPRVRAALARTAALLADEAALLRAEAEELLLRIGRDEQQGYALRRAGLAQAAPALARAALRQALAARGGLRQVGAAHVERALRLACAAGSSGRRVPLPGGRQARVTREELVIESRSNAGAKAVSSRGKA
jgi:tRNA(Ile)-lysidine synthase